MPPGCFALFPGTSPQRGSLTRVGLHIPQAGPLSAARQPQLCPARWPQGAVFSQRGPSEGSWRGEWAGNSSCLAGGPEGRGEDPGPGFCLRVQAGPLQTPFRVSLSPWEQPCSIAALHVLLRPQTCLCLGGPPPPSPDAKTWGRDSCDCRSREVRPDRSSTTP